MEEQVNAKFVEFEYSPEELAAMEDHYRQYLADTKHWLSKVIDRCWDEDVPWAMFVPRSEFVEVFEDAVAGAIAAAYYAGRRSALGQAEPYWQPPSAAKQNERHNNNAPTGSGEAMEEVPDGLR